MADPQQKSLEVPYLWRIPNAWHIPQWGIANQWRWFVYNQPIAMLCRQKLINYLLGIPWEVVSRNPDEANKWEEDTHYYTAWVLENFDTIFDLCLQDTEDLPIGGNVEIVRWPAGQKPDIRENGETYRVTGDHPKGHPFKLVNIDGATLFPTYDDDLPIAQRIPELDKLVYFRRDEIGRIGVQPRTEMRLKGYFKPPPEQVFLAMKNIGSSDKYFSDLLSDVPMSGVLDLLDMSQKSAVEWAESNRALFTSNEAIKMPVLYEHEKPAVWIPFNLPPTELQFDALSLRYARIVAASYGLTLGNIGLEPKGETLAGSIRDDMQAETGYGFIIEKVKDFLDSEVLPPYLEWQPKLQNYEKLKARGQAMLVVTQALKAAKEAGFIQPSEGQAQLKREGFITIEVEEPDDEAFKQQQALGQLGKQAAMANGAEKAKQLTEKVPPAEGGRGEITGKALVEQADYKYASTQFDMPDSIVRYIQGLQAKIDRNDLAPTDYGDKSDTGLEENPHLTIKDGLTSDDPTGVKAVARRFQPFSVQINRVSLFENEEFDVVKLDVVKDATLSSLNQAIAGTGSVDTHPGYTPHITIAYVKPGLGKKYLDLPTRPQSFMASIISHSTSDGYISKIPLGMVERALTIRAYVDPKPLMTKPVKKGLDRIAAQATPNRLKKIAKSATAIVFDYLVTKAETWEDELDKLIEAERWYLLPNSLISDMIAAYKAAFSNGAQVAAQEVIRLLPDLAIGLDFELTNPATLAQLEEKAALLIKRIDDGTRYYIKRALLKGVEEGMSSPQIAQMVKEGAGIDDILGQGGFLDDVVQVVKAELGTLTDSRLESIVNTEVNRAESEGRLKQWSEMGLTKKQWVTDVNPCPICTGNAAKGLVEMDYVYDDVFDGTQAPPAHPQVCRCHIEFSEAELMDKAGTLKVWSGD